MSNAPAPLAYAPPPPLMRRRRTRRIIGLVALLVIAGVTARWGPQYYRQGRLLYDQRRCLRYAAPPDQVVYEQDPAGPPAVLSRGGEYVPIAVKSYTPGPPVTAVGHVPRQAASLLAASGVTSSAAAVLFMGERRTPSGARYLLIICSDFEARMRPHFIAGYDVQPAIIRPATWSSPPALCSGAYMIDVMSMAHPTIPRFKIYAGQADPVDLTHFTIRYEWEGQTSIVNGYLRDYGAKYATIEFHPQN